MKLQAKQEPSTDPLLKQPHKKRDTVFFKDGKEYARIPWFHSNRPIKRKFVILNCYKWELDWV